LTIGDSTQIQNALLNLAVNARDAMPEGGELIFATETVDLDEDYCSQTPYDLLPGCYVQVSVTDSGVGMDLETKMRIFEPFFTTKEQGKGTGMGLAAVYGTVKNHRGAINVYSEPGHGSTFRVYLPCLSSDQAGPESGDSHSGDTKKGLRRHILLVDDEPMVLQMASDMLRKQGYIVTTASDGMDAVDSYRASPGSFDLVILDMIMPKQGGGETYRELKRIDPDVRVLLTSGYSLNGEAQKLLGKGVQGFIQKPYRRADLFRKVAAAFTPDRNQ
jgi:CheY-like chemotaxis protein